MSIAPNQMSGSLGPDISRPGQQLLPTYAVKLLKNLKIPFGTDRTMNGVDVDPTIPLISHIVDCLGVLRDVNKVYRAKGSLASRSVGARAMFGFTAELGNILLDSITFNPPIELKDAAVYYTAIGQCILSVFPEISAQVTKQSGKMLIHHTALKSSSIMAVEALKMVLKANPAGAYAQDNSGATALHWMTHNPCCSASLMTMLINANPKSPYVTDNDGYLPLHWAVNQDQPSIDAVAVLLQVNPGAASKPCNRGTLPLHWAVNRDNVNLSVLQALLEVYPDAARTFDDDGWLPLHRLVNRTQVCIEALQWLLEIYPQGLQCPNSDGHIPLHRLVDQAPICFPALEHLLDGFPGGVNVPDDEGYTPLHVALDCASPDSAVCLRILEVAPSLGSVPTKDGLLPLHCALSAAKPPLDVVQRLVTLFPEGIESVAVDILPADESANPETWQGAWKEKRWSPLSRAVERQLDPIVILFKSALIQARNQAQAAAGQGGPGNGSSPYLENAHDQMAARTSSTRTIPAQAKPPLNPSSFQPTEMYRAGSALDSYVDDDDEFLTTPANGNGNTNGNGNANGGKNGGNGLVTPQSRNLSPVNREHGRSSQGSSRSNKGGVRDNYDSGNESNGPGSQQQDDRRAQSRSRRHHSSSHHHRHSSSDDRRRSERSQSRSRRHRDEDGYESAPKSRPSTRGDREKDRDREGRSSSSRKISNSAKKQPDFGQSPYNDHVIVDIAPNSQPKKSSRYNNSSDRYDDDQEVDVDGDEGSFYDDAEGPSRDVKGPSSSSLANHNHNHGRSRSGNNNNNHNNNNNQYGDHSPHDHLSGRMASASIDDMV